MASFAPEGDTFDVMETGESTGKMHAGTFRVKLRLSWRDQLQQDKMRRELLGADANNANPDAVAQAIILSELSVRVMEAPEWWVKGKGGLDLYDDNVISKVYEETRKLVNAIELEKAKEADEARAEIKDIKAKSDEAIPVPPKKANRKPMPIEE
jgi:hypothetical protein